jgi:mannose-6-phosphate isomerase-like protein (cupin superfamily)
LQPRIVRAKTLTETRSSERCFIAENWSSQKLSVARATVKPGDTTVLHHLEDVDEIYIIVKGKGKVNVGKLEPTNVKKGDTVFIPAGISQQITNSGETDLVFYCICSPRFTQRCYISEE